jgi:hypothetical protein
LWLARPSAESPEITILIMVNLPGKLAAEDVAKTSYIIP